MKKLAAVFSVAALALAISGTTSALVLTFDDVSTIVYEAIPDGYGGLDWDNMTVVDGTWYSPGSGYDNGTVSEDYVALNLGGDPASILVSAGEGFPAFDFEGAYLTAAWSDGLNINVVGSLGGSEVYNQTVVVDTDGPTWFDFDYYNVDTLVFSSFIGEETGLGYQFAMDNFTYTPIPEPTTMLMLGCLGAGLAGTRKLRSKK
jgi:hypothetical protein